MDNLRLGNRTVQSRLFLGTGKFSCSRIMEESIRRSGTQLVTVALRRFNENSPEEDLLRPLVGMKGIMLMPNTSGARTAGEAVTAALLGRELCGSSLVKLEIHPNPHHLLPDPIETYHAAVELVKLGFDVMPYIPADPVLAKRLEEVGCASVMPLGSAIGSGNGLQTLGMLSHIIRDSTVPVVVDAGLRSPADAAAAIEAGCDAVLVNSAIAAAGDPPGMAEAFAMAVQAGFKARQAGIMTQNRHAVATSPLTSFLTQSAREAP